MVRIPGADVECFVIGICFLECQQVRLHDVTHVDEVTRLLTIFEDERSLAIQQT